MKTLGNLLKKYFIPHEHNEFKPHFLRHKSALIVLLVVLVIELVFLAEVFIVFDKTNFLASVLPGALTSLTNEERAQNNAEPLTTNELLTKAAQLKANDMAKNEYFAHTSPDGKTPWYWLNQVGYQYSLAGENLAINFFESQDVAEAWMNSPTHRANIVKQNYKEVGIAVANGTYQGSNTVFVAQFFGTPMVATPPTQNTNPIPSAPVATAKTKSTTTPTPKPHTTPTQAIPKPTTTNTIVVTPTTTRVLGEEINTIPASQVSQFFSDLKSFIQKLMTSPDKFVNYTYTAIVIVILSAMLFGMLIRREMGHRPNVVRGLAIITVIVIITVINIKIFHVETHIPAESFEASVIAY